ncbi:ABC transporter ATP-binding protein [Bombilactobacillus thymidiniphilus]|uniref:ABC transporter ATP-binding protein n=1 Tax=Bombilactobacillus thymidiniphilus TaxID=2923363 RepID=A0ABY4PC61_9LACO|nr:ABC transporter ATP-binding protein [Bombilactobacillus thymidiniphilus]UQS83344.1 ABC transporter ATP-binding protein [Bombilactobacillus thymidiniphilus]
MTLKVDNLTGGYGRLPVIKNESFTVKAGETVGLIGLNGAGKSTTIKNIIGLLQPQSGSITIDGLRLKDDITKYRQQIAYVPELPVLYPELTLREHIEVTMMAYDLPKEATWQQANELLKTFRLADKLDWFPINFSKGMKQKVMIVCAFMTTAKLYIIDEPFTGLDPLAVRDLLALIKEKKSHGAAILMSTHILANAEQNADRFVLLNHGKVRAEGSLDQLKTKFGTQDANLDDLYVQMSQED